MTTYRNHLRHIGLQWWDLALPAVGWLAVYITTKTLRRSDSDTHPRRNP